MLIDRKFNFVMALSGAAGGVAGHFAGGKLSSYMGNAVLRAAVHLSALILCIVLFCVVAETLFPVINGRLWRRKYAGVTWKYLVPAAIIPALLLGAASQFLYQLDIAPHRYRDVYLLIDRSGSMEWNDPANERMRAARRFIDGFDGKDRVEVISFDNSADVEVPLFYAGDEAALSLLNEKLRLIGPRGGTDFNAPLNMAYEHIQGRAERNNIPVVILLSDGISDADEDIIEGYSREGIVIHTVGLLLEEQNGIDELESISFNTGGQFVLAEETDQLDLAFEQVMHETGEEYILNPKAGFDAARFLLFTLAGLVIGLVLAFIFDNRYIMVPMAAGGTLSGMIAGGLMCLPVGLLIPSAALGFIFTWFTLFSKTPPPSLNGEYAAETESFLKTESQGRKTHGRF